MHPLTIRKGIRLFDDSDTTMPLELLKSEAFKTGVLNLVYGPDGSPPEGGYEEAIEALAKADQ